jgi:hypothetical protein
MIRIELHIIAKFICDFNFKKMIIYAELQKKVRNAVKWKPSFYAAEIVLTIKKGVFILDGIVDIYFRKMGTANSAKNLVVIKTVDEKIPINSGVLHF